MAATADQVATAATVDQADMVDTDLEDTACTAADMAATEDTAARTADTPALTAVHELLVFHC